MLELYADGVRRRAMTFDGKMLQLKLLIFVPFQARRRRECERPHSLDLPGNWRVCAAGSGS
jgi:hypothetical protein